MVTKFFSRSALHEHADPAQRILGAAELPPDSGELARLLAAAAKNKDRGVARHARQQIDAIEDRLDRKVEADAILAQLEALAVRTGPILSAVVELDRRWQALDLSGDAVRRDRYDAARRTV